MMYMSSTQLWHKEYAKYQVFKAIIVRQVFVRRTRIITTLTSVQVRAASSNLDAYL